jgi:peptide chain release factor 1
MFEKLKTIENKYEELTRLLMEPEIFSKPSELQKYSKEQSDLLPLVGKIREYNKLLSDIEGAEDLLKSGDGDLRELADQNFMNSERKKPVKEELSSCCFQKIPVMKKM